jgi:protein SCO1
MRIYHELNMKPLHLISVAITALLIGCYQSEEPVTTKTATIVNPPIPLAELSLVQHNGTAFDHTTLQGKWTLMFFGFTFCPDVCPTTLQLLALSLQKIEQSGIENAQVVFVSVDPERDTPERLEEYLAHFDEKFIGVTGELTDIESFTQSIGVVFAHNSLDESGFYAVDHTTVILMVNDKAELGGISSAPHKWEDIADDFMTVRAQ